MANEISFIPVRGLEEDISNQGIVNGHIYFAYDSGKIYIDKDNKRYLMGGGGSAAFVYSNTAATQIDDYYTLPLSSITSDITIKIDDIIVSGDNKLCRVTGFSEDGQTLICNLIMSGGGGTGTGRILSIKAVTGKAFPDYCMKALPITAQYTISSNMSADLDSDVDIIVKVNDVAIGNAGATGVVIGTPFTITIPANTLEESLNNKIQIIATLDEDTGKLTKNSIAAYVVTFNASNSWNYLKPFLLTENLEFPFTYTGINENALGHVKVYIDDILAVETVKDSATLSSSIIVTADTLQQLAFEHGTHTLTVEGLVYINSKYLSVNSLNYDIMLVDSASDVPIIISQYNNTREKNYDIIKIPLMVYQRNVFAPKVKFYVNNEQIGDIVEITTSLTNEYIWEIVDYNIAINAEGLNVFTVTCGAVSRTWEVQIYETDETRTLNPVTDNLVLNLTPFGRSNSETKKSRSIWTSGTYSAEFNNFNWYNNGWIVDDEKVTALRISNGATVKLPISTILSQATASPLTIEIEFKPRNITNFSRLIEDKELYQYKLDPNGDTTLTEFALPGTYPNTTYPDAVIMYEEDGTTPIIKMTKVVHTEEGVICKYYNGNAGFCLGTQEAFFTTDKSTVNVRYAENEKIKVSFVVDQWSTSNGIMYIYLNGVVSGAARFTTDSFAANCSAIEFNSTYCDIDLYRIKIYSKALDYGEIVQNWVGDAPNLATKLDRNSKNNSIRKYDGNNDPTISYSKVKASNLIPIMVLTNYPNELTSTTGNTVYNTLPWAKTDEARQVIDVRYYDPANPDKSFRAQRISIDVQGTSSQGYPRRNYKIKIKKKDSSTYNSKVLNADFPYYLQTWDGDEANVTNSLNGTSIKKYDIGTGIGETSYCLKADYMESSSTHNTGLANLIQYISTLDGDSSFDFRHPLVQKGVMTLGQARTTIYGFPILLFQENKGSGQEPQFIGKYNFNVDKGATNTFGFSNGSQQPYMSSTVTATETQKWALRCDEPNVTDDPYYIEFTNWCTANPTQNFQTLYASYIDYSSDGKTILKPVKFKSNLELCKFAAAVTNVEGLYTFTYNGATWDMTVQQASTVDSVYILATESTVVASGLTKEVLESTYGITFEVYIEASLTTTSKFWFVLTPSLPLVISRGVVKTYEEASECWEFTNNKGGRTSFLLDDNTDLTKTDPMSRHPGFFSLDSDGHLDCLNDFEMRYHIADYDTTEMYTASGAVTSEVNTEIAGYMSNFADLYSWVNSTATANATGNALTTPYWAATRDTKFASGKTYYSAANDSSASYSYTEILDENTKDLNYCEITITTNSVAVVHKYIKQYHIVEKTDADGNTYNTYEPYYEYYIDSVQQADVTEIAQSVTNLYEKYTTDTVNYRLSKFKKEFMSHFNMSYCALYSVLTNLLIMFDSRAKNIMLASWGPESTGGNYIWYPIFYDMDTQLGVNNSGVVYWDYDSDCEKDNIYSGASSAFWANMNACFSEQIQNCYRWLRNKGAISYEVLHAYYDINQSDKWSELMKNADAYYKYIVPARSKNDEIVSGSYGYINKSNTRTYDDFGYLYCLQGDRKLNRDAFFTNRLNYKDSEWFSGVYTQGVQGGTAIQLRYNANASNTSDPTKGVAAITDTTNVDYQLESDLQFNVKTYLTQYCTVFYDETPIKPSVKYEINGDNEYAVLNPPAAVAQAIAAGTDLQQQLLYFYGAEYIEDLGDLSTKYLDEVWLSPAVRLRKLKLGNDYVKYENSRLNSVTNLNLSSAEGDSLAKTLLTYLDLSNLKALTDAVNIGGCLKLNTFKALGSRISGVTLPSGSVFTTIYLPSTVTGLQLLEPKSLTKVIHNNKLVVYAENKKHNGIECKGLYVAGLTDAISLSAEGVYSYTPATSTPIADFRTDNTLLKFETYELLKFLVNAKKTERATNTSAQMLLSMKNVDWSEYEKLEIDATYDSSTICYIINDKGQYERYVMPSTEAQWKLDLAKVGIYIKNALTTYELLDMNATQDTTQTYYVLNSSNQYVTYTGTSWATDLLTTDIYRKISIKNPISDLSLLDMFIKLDTSNDGYHDIFKDPYRGSSGITQSFIPTITGRLHVSNADGIAINEYDVFNTYNNSAAFPNLEITADKITECYRTKFIEIDPNGYTIKYNVQKNSNADASVSWPDYSDAEDGPGRQHYDFLGWSSDTSLIDTKCVIDENSTVEYIAQADWKDITFGTCAAVYYAVYKLHKYNITFRNDDGTEITTLQITSGLKLHAPDIIPSKDSSSLALLQNYNFIGYGYAADTVARDITKITSSKDLDLYAKYELVANIKNYPLDESNFIIAINSSTKLATIKINKILSGKICIPAKVTVEDVEYNVDVLTGAMDVTENDTTYLAKCSGITHVFFEQGSTITHIGKNAFREATNLKYFEMVSTIWSLSEACFNQCTNLSFAVNDLKNVTTYESSVFTNLGLAVSSFTLQLNNELHFSSYVFNQANISSFQLGSAGSPVTSSIYNQFASYTSGSPVFGGTTTLMEIKIYITNISESTAVDTALKSILGTTNDNFTISIVTA